MKRCSCGAKYFHATIIQEWVIFDIYGHLITCFGCGKQYVKRSNDGQWMTLEEFKASE